MKQAETIKYPGAFTSACSSAGIEATRRQWKKWCQGRGKAYNTKHKEG